MSKGNENNTQELVQRIVDARDALDAALKILESDGAKRKPTKRMPTSKEASPKANKLDFSMPIRAFVKVHGSGLNGAKKFTLLLAYLTNGDSSKTVPLSEVETHWNKMTGKTLLGMKFNRLYTSQAKENDWTTTEKAGEYRLRPSWRAIFND